MLTRRSTRRGERGQVLIMALGFVVFFALVTTAVLQFANTVELQQSHSQSTNISHADAEGGMFFAVQAAAAQGGCVAGSTASIAMTTGARATATTMACNPGATAVVLADQCAVCITGQAGGTPALDVTGTLTAQGPIAVNGDADSTGPAPSVTSTVSPSGVPEPGFIACSGSCGPSSTSDYSPPAGHLTAPMTVAAPSGLPSPPGGGYVNLNQMGGGVVDPGAYHNLDLSSGAFTLQGGVYFITGRLTVRDAIVTASLSEPVLLYLLDHGDIALGKDSTLSLGLVSGYQDTVVYVEPADVNGDISIGSSAVLTVSGRLIVASLNDAGTVQVTATPPDPGYCWVYDDSVTVTGSAGTAQGQVLVESDCSARKSTGIISIAYEP